MTGVPRTTVRDWRRGGVANRIRSTTIGCAIEHNLAALPPSAYAYLLGLYLGDGYLVRRPRGVWQIRVSMDDRYPGIVHECRVAMEMIMGGQHAHSLHRGGHCLVVSMYSKHWPCLFPQHGSGRKHERRISLLPWQEEIVRSQAEIFVRGLIHSDGCRVTVRDRGARSVRYYFSNRSEDIKSLFCDALDGLGVHWTRPSDRQIAIYRKADVGRLDRFIGPKR
jgi:hypothetical protein